MISWDLPVVVFVYGAVIRQDNRRAPSSQMQWEEYTLPAVVHRHNAARVIGTRLERGGRSSPDFLALVLLLVLLLVLVLVFQYLCSDTSKELLTAVRQHMVYCNVYNACKQQQPAIRVKLHGKSRCDMLCSR